MSKRLIQDLHAGISRRDWSAVETAANRLRDEVEATIAILAGTAIGGLPNDYPLSKLAAEAPSNLWQGMGTAPKDRTEVIIACPCAGASGDYVVSAAYFNADAYDGTWWWSGTQMGEWGDSPIEDINEPPAFWQPMPASPTSKGPSQ